MSSMEFVNETTTIGKPIIKVVGVGGGGSNAVNCMVDNGLEGVELIAMNTDAQALNKSKAHVKLQLGEKLTRGLGAGANPETGREAAEESRADIEKLLRDTQMVFITAGMGGGTGTGAAPVVAAVAAELGILSVGIVTKPFGFEGKRKRTCAEQGIERLMEKVDSLIVIPNERLKGLSNEKKLSFRDTFAVADNVLREGVESIAKLINMPAEINLDFADVSKIMKKGGYAHMGTGSAKGENKATLAAEAAMCSPLLETAIDGADNIIMSMVMSPDLVFEDASLAAEMITDRADPDAFIIWGAAYDENLEDELRITIVATSLHSSQLDGEPVPAPVQAPVQVAMDSVVPPKPFFQGDVTPVVAPQPVQTPVAPQPVQAPQADQFQFTLPTSEPQKVVPPEPYGYEYQQGQTRFTTPQQPSQPQVTIPKPSAPVTPTTSTIQSDNGYEGDFRSIMDVLNNVRNS